MAPMGAAATATTPSAAGDWPVDALEVGRIVEPWGLKGWLRIQPFSSDPQALLGSRRWHLAPRDQASAIKAPGPTALPSRVDVTRSKPHGDGIVAQLAGVDDRDAAERFAGARVFVARSAFPKTDVDEFYWADLIGLSVLNRDGVRLGRVVGLIDTGAHSVLRVGDDAAGQLVADPADPAAAERLIPFVAAYVDTVDLAAGSITVDWGLDY